MIHIVGDTTLGGALAAERAAIVFRVPWSIYAVQAAWNVERWEWEWLPRGQCLPIDVFCADPEAQPAVVDWLKRVGHEGLVASGGGEVLWLERGRVVATTHPGGSKLALVQTAKQLWPVTGP